MIKAQPALKNTKITIAVMLAVQIIYFFLPLNTYNGNYGNLPKILSEILSVGKILSPEIVYFLGAIGLGINILIFLISVLIKDSNRFRAIALPFFLATSIIFGFCWGMLMDKLGFVRALYCFAFIYVVSSVVCAVLTLNLDEKRVTQKEL